MGTCNASSYYFTGGNDFGTDASLSFEEGFCPHSDHFQEDQHKILWQWESGRPQAEVLQVGFHPGISVFWIDLFVLLIDLAYL